MSNIPQFKTKKNEYTWVFNRLEVSVLDSADEYEDNLNDKWVSIRIRSVLLIWVLFDDSPKRGFFFTHFERLPSLSTNKISFELYSP